MPLTATLPPVLTRADLALGLPRAFTATAVVGAVAGAALTARVPKLALKRVSAALLLVGGGFVLYQDRDALRALTVSSLPSSPSSPASVTATAIRG